MAIPTDRGYAVIIPNADHTTTVMVSTGIENASPVGSSPSMCGLPGCGSIRGTPA